MEQRTYFHLPGDNQYDPITHTGIPMHHPISGAGYIFLRPGDEVTLEGYRERYRVARVYFHHGHGADLGGLHLYLEDAQRAG